MLSTGEVSRGIDATVRVALVQLNGLHTEIASASSASGGVVSLERLRAALADVLRLLESAPADPERETAESFARVLEYCLDCCATLPPRSAERTDAILLADTMKKIAIEPLLAQS
jgi:hypothetical protein